MERIPPLWIDKHCWNADVVVPIANLIVPVANAFISLLFSPGVGWSFWS
jgi:hypothetical protein